MKKVWLSKVVLGVVLISVLISGFACGFKTDIGKTSKTAPEIEVDSWLNTEPLTLKKLRGKIVVLEFWAIWCPPCRKSIPHLIKMHNNYKDKGVVLISITDEPLNKIRSFVKKNKMIYPIGSGGSTSKKYNIRGIPHAVIIDRDGIIIWKGHPMAGLDEALKKAVGE